MKQLVILLLVVLYHCDDVIATNCPLPTDAQIISDIVVYLQSQSGDAGTPFTVTLSEPVQYTCLATGTVRDTYSFYSVVANFTSAPSRSVTLVHFQRRCNSGTWAAVSGDSFETSVPNNLQPPTRTNCFQCTNQLGDPHHCRQCNPPCPGSGRCHTDLGALSCCSYFATDGTCTDNCTTSDGPNYIANSSTDYECTCNLTCLPGDAPNFDCTSCELSDICIRYSPCQNGGSCNLLSSPDNYTCNCSGAGNYIGMNCTQCSLTCNAGYVPNSDCTYCELHDICAAGSPCLNGGMCTLLASPDSYMCTCSGPGNFTGINCTICSLNCLSGYEANTDCTQCVISNICLANTPCKNGGSCTLVSAPDSYSCDCTGTGHGGMNCTSCIPLACSPGYITNTECTQCVLNDICIAVSPCQNGGSCTLDTPPDRYTCHCSNHYSGTNCTDCSIACNNGSANSNCDGCICRVGYTGMTCNAIDYCDPNPCGAHGMCELESPDGYRCQCIDGWRGDNCEQCPILHCSECRGTPLTCTSCRHGYKPNATGTECIIDLCSSNPCHNNGTCDSSQGSSYTCSCVKPWTGDDCTECTEPGYGLKGLLCVPCDSNGCIDCARNASTCEQCNPNFELNPESYCEQVPLPTFIIVWIVIGCILAALLMMAAIVATIVLIIRLTGKAKEKHASKKANKDAFKASDQNQVAKNPLYISSEEMNRVIIEEDEEIMY